MRDRILYTTISLLMAAGLIVAAPAFAQTKQGQGGAPGGWVGSGHMIQRPPMVFGSVTAVGGDTITLASRGFGRSAATTTYTIDATNATVTKDGSASSAGAIAVGDTLMVQGTVSGNSVTATKINDGMPKGMPGMPGMRGGMASSTRPQVPSIQGNGEPVIGGSITAISGDTLTITNKSNVAYTVDATSATVVKGNATSSLSAIAVGDNVLVQGSVSGNAVTASSIIDQGAAQAPGNGNGGSAMSHGIGGVFGAIGGFFQHLFGW